jgi:succinate-semialdehyde dehydrogenase/glutarate-semialdehyde dehydrogenase
MTATQYPNTKLLISNQWVDASGGKTLDVRNPATGEVIGKVAHAGKNDLDRALQAAQEGFRVWRNTSAHERAATMRRAAALLRERAGDIARLLTQEQGKPLAEATGETLAGANLIE